MNTADTVDTVVLPEAPMGAILRLRLSTLMFLEFFVWGAWYVTLGTWLATGLHLSGQQIGWTAGTTAVGAVISPLFAGLIADRFLPTQVFLALFHGLGAVLLTLASYQTSFGAVYLAILLYSLCYMPTLALANSLTFRQITNPKQQFGSIRVMGTIGWIVAGLIVGGTHLETTSAPLRIAAAASAILALYCLTLPHTPPLANAGAWRLSAVFPKDALVLLKDRSLAVFAAASLLICIPLQFYYAFTNLFLNEVGVQGAAAKMTGGQMSELACMLLIPWFFRRWGVKYMLAAGMFAWVLRYLFFAFGDSSSLMWMFWIGILLHGICFDFFFVVGQIYIDEKAPAALRAATQGLITQITYGVGMLAGSWLSGSVVDAYAGGGGHDWLKIWLIAAAVAAAVLVAFLLLFRPDVRPYSDRGR